MAFKRQRDSGARRASRTIAEFRGVHYGTGLTDQPQDFSYGGDLEYSSKKPELRNGRRKNQLNGFTGTITSIIDLNIGGLALVGIVIGGKLSVYPVADMLEQIRGYYTWDEVKETFTWDSLKGKTWDDLIQGNR